MSHPLQLLAQLADDFIEEVVAASSRLAKHRKSSSLDVKDLRVHLGGCDLIP